MKYAVRVEYIGHAWVEVEAESSEEAHDKALEIGVNMDAGDFSYDTEVSVYDSVIDEEPKC
jgi:hypothetical protein